MTNTPVPLEPGTPEPTPYAVLVTDFLQPQCIKCHSGPMAKGDLDLSTYEGVLSAIVPGDPDESLLYLMVEWDEMPPKGGVSQETKDFLKEWIKNGAKR